MDECVLPACAVANHRVKCWEVVAKDSPTDITQLCISCAPAGGSSITTAVFWGTNDPIGEVKPNHRRHGTIHRRIEDSFPVSAKPTRHHDGGSKRVCGTNFEVYNLAAINKDVLHPLDTFSEDLGLTQEDTTVALRVAWEPLLANQYILQDLLPAHTEGQGLSRSRRISSMSRKQASFEPLSSKMTLVSARQNRALEACSNLRLLPRKEST
jgi:hypothetical protein